MKNLLKYLPTFPEFIAFFFFMVVMFFVLVITTFIASILYEGI